MWAAAASRTAKESHSEDESEKTASHTLTENLIRYLCGQISREDTAQNSRHAAAALEHMLAQDNFVSLLLSAHTSLWYAQEDATAQRVKLAAYILGAVALSLVKNGATWTEAKNEKLVVMFRRVLRACDSGVDSGKLLLQVNFCCRTKNVVQVMFMFECVCVCVLW